jgi:DNA-binding IclR family transcriptional regulator
MASVSREAERVEEALSRGTAMTVPEVAESTQLSQAEVERALADLEGAGRVIPAHGGRWGLPPTRLEDEPTKGGA